MEKALIKAFPSYSVQLSYPTAPHRLESSSIPGFNSDFDLQDVEPAYGWWRRKDIPQGDGSEEPEIIYQGLQIGLARIAQTIKEQGPFDGVIGFSQGACAAGMVSSLLDGSPEARLEGFAAVPHGESFPSNFLLGDGSASEPKLVQPPVKFGVIYSGFRAPGNRHQGFYEPRIRTRTMHFLGALDTVVDEGRSRSLIEVCEEAEVVVHPGGHFLPTQKPWLDAVIGFIERCMKGDGQGNGKGDGKHLEEKVEDMDVPF